MFVEGDERFGGFSIMLRLYEDIGGEVNAMGIFSEYGKVEIKRQVFREGTMKVDKRVVGDEYQNNCDPLSKTTMRKFKL